jgi:RNA polymerase sigma factor (sigma-70 family)
MATDNELLRKYAQAGSEPAFKELVQRHVNMVYATALRETDANPHMAEDLAQSVFVELARKAKSLEQHPALAGWLYTCVRLTAANARRAEVRRQRRQQEYQTMAELHSSESPESTLRQIQPALDDAQLSFQLAQGIQDLDFLHFLLRTRSETLRLKKVAEFLSEYVPRQRLAASMKKLAPLNGHGTRGPEM